MALLSALGLTVLSAGVVVAGGTGRGGSVYDPTGGFQVTLPDGWVRHHPDADHLGVLLRADDNAYYGRWPQQWVWVVRWAGAWHSIPAAVDSIMSGVRDQGGTDIARGTATIGDLPAVTVSWTSPAAIPWISGVRQAGPTRTTDFVFGYDNHLFEVGLARRGSSDGRLTPQLSSILASFATVPIRGIRHLTVDGLRLDVPAEWDLVQKKDRHGALAEAVAPGPTLTAWFYVFSATAKTPTTAAQNAMRSIAAAGGRDLLGPSPATLGPQAALRLDFGYPVSDAPGTYSSDTEWFFARGGHTFILADGALTPDMAAATSGIASTLATA